MEAMSDMISMCWCFVTIITAMVLELPVTHKHNSNRSSRDTHRVKMYGQSSQTVCQGQSRPSILSEPVHCMMKELKNPG